MKNSNYIINGILIIAVIVLFILHFTGRRTNAKSHVTSEFYSDSTGVRLPLAFVRTDSLLANYKFSINLNEEMLKKVEDESLGIKRRQDRFERNVADFQQKAQNNVFLTQERYQQEESRLIKERDDYQTYAASVERELAFERARMNRQLQDTVKAALKIFNTPKKYEIIFCDVDNDNILFAEDLYDITDDVVEFLNDRYVPEKK